MPSRDDHSWAIGVAGWIIQDGNYEDFGVGDSVRFAVEAYALTFATISGDRPPSAMRVTEHGTLYDIEGRVLYARERAWILDIGILVYGNREDLPGGVQVGDTVAGRAYLGIAGPAVYPESFQLPPEASHHWHIREIESETTPWLDPTPDYHAYRRDPDRVSFVSVARTGAWNDDPPRHHPYYVLHCRLLPRGA
jgi:hypothetical protein